ncbi:MAG TPA: MauE/DoxX family redox-associated membrane protein [Chitinophaga sp.]|uniref:MauE/DoxX family redox-associated membrane protein n=1 Tax=Chitinophaga sp. TaxID=1869181 RepID=UPI002D1080FB|nr:MauE/DoxX family redox-associated membrane protein [Chitinophaga sp.]HVI47814.1 MauE/DoxX family redox-associated membrane protein [Chitinophaga sp.]
MKGNTGIGLTPTRSWKHTVVEISGILFILLLVYAAVAKLSDVEKFRNQLGQSSMLLPYVSWLYWGIPMTEITLSVMLIFTATRLPALYGCFFLMTLFTVYIFIVTRYSDQVPCSCGGIIQELSWDQHLVFNLFFIVLAALGVLVYPGRRSPEDIAQ